MCATLIAVGTVGATLPGATAAQTPTRTIGGMVVDAARGTPLAGVSIMVGEGGPETTTGSDGRFRIEGASGAGLELTVGRIGYEELRVTVPSGSADALLLRLLPRPIDLDGFDVAPVTHADLTGVVLDAVSGAGVPRPYLSIDGRRVGTSTGDGTFVIEALRVGRHLILVEGLGYESLYLPVTIRGPSDPVTLALEPDPILLEGIATMARRLDSRRRAYGFGPVRAWEEDALHAAREPNAVELMRVKHSLDIVPCRGGGMGDCLRMGTRTTAPRVMIDEMPIPCGLTVLATYRPSELYLLEIYDRGMQIRAYTRDYMTRRGGRPGGLIPADVPPPLLGC